MKCSIFFFYYFILKLFTTGSNQQNPALQSKPQTMGLYRARFAIEILLLVDFDVWVQ